MEEWRKIDGYPDYSISDHGRVRRDVATHSWRANRLLKSVLHEGGYEIVSLHRDGSGLNKKVHRLVAIAFIPNPDGLPTVNHIDGNKRNNLASNLAWASYADQARHALRTGLVPTGQYHFLAKISDEEVRKIRDLAGTMTYREIGQMFGVSTGHAANIIYGKDRNIGSTPRRVVPAPPEEENP